MDARVRAFDWSRTSIGPMDRWPQSLRTAVGTVLSAPVPMALWWGPDLTLIYNDGYAPFFGLRHPDALGRSGRDVWSEAWPKIGPFVEAVMERGESVSRERDHFVLDRHGSPEDTWFTWSYSPVPDESGRVGGLLNIAHEDTAAVRAEAARRAGEDRLRALATTSGAVLYRVNADWSEVQPLDGKGLIPSTDRPDRDWMNRNLPTSEHAAVRERISHCIATKTPFEMEHRVNRPDGSIGWTRSRAVPVLNDAGEIVEWVGTAEDVTERQHWVATLAETRRKLDSALIAGEVGTFEWDVSNDRLWGDQNFERIFGIKLDASGAAPLTTYVAALHPADRNRVLEQINRSVETGCDYESEYRVTSTVPPRWVTARGKVERDDAGRVIRFPGVVLDETERKEAELLLSAQNRALELVAAGAPVAEALGVLTQAVESQYDGNAVAAILLVDEDGCTLRTGAAPSLPPEYCAAIDGIRAKPGLGTCADAAARNAVVVTTDIAAAPSWGGLSHLPLALGLKAAWSMPIRASDGRVLGTFGTYFRECREPSARERHIVESLCVAAALAVERRRADEALRASEGRFRFLSDLAEQTRGLTDPERVMATVARTLGEHLKVSRCAYAEVESDSDGFTIRHDYTNGCPSSVGTYRLDLFGPRAAADQRSGRTLVIHDVDAELAPAEGGDTFNAIGIKAIVCCPLVRRGRLMAMMAVHQTMPRRWTPDEVALIEVVVERSWAYIERARAVRGVAESEARFRQLADAMPQMIWVARPDGHHEYYNHQWYEFTGVPTGSTDGEGWNGMFHPQDQERAWAAWRHSLDTGEPYEIEYRLRHRSGEYRWTLGRALPIRNASGAITRWFGTCTDIDAIKRLMAEREHLLVSELAARAEAERAGRMKDEFLATLSHELRTPLNAILGWATILQGDGAAGEDDLREGLEAIERNARAQTQIIEDLLDMSRIISGKVRLDVQQVDLAAVVRGAVETVKHAADAKAIRVHAVLDPLDGPVFGDPGRLQQVFWNLLTNAIKFTPKGGRVQVLLERVNSHVEVRVTDTGEGIRPEFLPHVFDRFKQADASTTRRHGGLGLGLGIVKQLVELHGGTVTVRSAGVGRGSTFVVALPVTAVQPDAHEEPERRHPDSTNVAVPVWPDLCKQIAGIKVLVVDDEADSRAIVQRLLEACDAIVFASGSASDAVERVAVERPDVLVSDIGMPDEDGYSLIRRVRALGPERGGNVPAVALTAYARSEDRTRSILAGFQMHIAKPVEPSELIAMVASLAGRTR